MGQADRRRVKRVWQAVTSEDELARWFMRSRVDLRVGGEALFHLDDPFGGTISELDRPRLFEVVYGDGFFRVELGEEEVAFVERLQTNAPVPGDGSDPALTPAGGPGRTGPS